MNFSYVSRAPGATGINSITLVRNTSPVRLSLPPLMPLFATADKLNPPPSHFHNLRASVNLTSILFCGLTHATVPICTPAQYVRITQYFPSIGSFSVLFWLPVALLIKPRSRITSRISFVVIFISPLLLFST